MLTLSPGPVCDPAAGLCPKTCKSSERFVVVVDVSVPTVKPLSVIAFSAAVFDNPLKLGTNFLIPLPMGPNMPERNAMLYPKSSRRLGPRLSKNLTDG